MSLTYENPVAWRRASQILTGTVLITAALAARAVVPINGGPVTQAGTTDNGGSQPATLTISSPAVSDVVKMVDAKVDPTVIKAFIQNATTTFNPSASDLIALKNHGVPDDILTAMLERGAQVRTQIAQALQKQAPPAPSYEAAPPSVAAPAPEAAYPADYGSYAAPYGDYSYAYPYGYSYPYSYWYNYGYPYYSYYWPYYGYYGHYYCGYHGCYHSGHYAHCYPGYGHGNGHWNGNHPSPHSTGTFVNHSGGSGRPGPYSPVGTQSRPASFAMNRSPLSPVAARSASFAMNRGASAPMSAGARPASFARAGGGGFSAGHVGGGARAGGGGGHVGGGGHR